MSGIWELLQKEMETEEEDSQLQERRREWGGARLLDSNSIQSEDFE